MKLKIFACRNLELFQPLQVIFFYIFIIQCSFLGAVMNYNSKLSDLSEPTENVDT